MNNRRRITSISLTLLASLTGPMLMGLSPAQAQPSPTKATSASATASTSPTAAVIPPAPVAASAAAIPAPKAREPKATDSGGFTLTYPTWEGLPEHGTQKGLVARYTWGGNPERVSVAESKTEDGKTVWVLTFPDQPRPKETSPLKLFWLFGLKPGSQEAIRAAVDDILKDTFQAVIEASDRDEAKRNKKFEDAIVQLQTKTGLATAIATLSRYADASGNNGLTVLLTKLGLEQTKEGWKLTRAGLERLVRVSRKIPRTSDAQFFQKAMDRYQNDLDKVAAEPSEKTCESRQSDFKAANTEANARAALQACVPALAGIIQKRAKDLDQQVKEYDLQESQEKNPARLQQLRQKKASRDKNADSSKKLTSQAEALAKAFEQSAQGTPDYDLDSAVAGLDPAPYSYNAAAIDSLFLQKEQAESDKQAELSALSSDITGTLEETLSNEVTSTSITGADRPRRYDVSTGAVFVTGLQDWVVPTFISMCLSHGCLKPDEVSWTAPRGGLRMISLDVGVRTKTLDTQDARQSDKVSFLFGASLNPLSVLRVSGGMYTFENAQTKNWNARPYVGFTLNILNAAELLGNLGLSNQVPPSTSQ